MPKVLNLLIYAYSVTRESYQSQFDEIRGKLNEWSQLNVLESLARYGVVVHDLLAILRDALKHSSSSTHDIAEDVFKEISQDVSVLREKLVVESRNKDSYLAFMASRADLAQELLDLLQDLLDLFPKSPDSPRLYKMLIRLSRKTGLHPACFPLSGPQVLGPQAASGGFADIWKGVLAGGYTISIKVMRVFQEVEVKAALKQFGREAIIWRQLSHPNVLPFVGLYFVDSRLCLVSPWMSKGHILEFLKDSTSYKDRLSLMLDVAMGLEYLHGKGVVHGDLKGANILITPSNRACVADFGLSTVVDSMSKQFPHSTPTPRGGTARYQAPELLLASSESTSSDNSPRSDIYALACTFYEIWTGKLPFFELKQDIAVAIRVLNERLRPSRPQAISADHSLWRLLQDCWKEKPEDRPTASQVVQRLAGSAIGAKSNRASTDPDWDDAFTSRCRRSCQERPLLLPASGIERIIIGQGHKPSASFHLSRSSPGIVSGDMYSSTPSYFRRTQSGPGRISQSSTPSLDSFSGTPVGH